MRKHILATGLLVLFSVLKGQSQVILNGDFEDNNLTNCNYNLLNNTYNNIMNNSWGFGSGEELDIQHDTCGYNITPSGSNWFVSISKKSSGEYDALSLRISVPLTMGTSYQISYWSYSADTFSNNIVPLEIGLSTDSLSFGTQIHSSVPTLNTWTQQSFTFTAPNNGQYLTIRTDSAGMSLKGWTFIDNFVFDTNNSIATIKKLETTIYPNPANHQVTVASNIPMKILTVYDLMGREVVQQACNGANTIQLNTSNWSSGYYIVNVQGENNSNYRTKLCITKAK